MMHCQEEKYEQILSAENGALLWQGAKLQAGSRRSRGSLVPSLAQTRKGRLPGKQA